MGRKLVKPMPSVKKRRKEGNTPLVIGSPQNFRKGTEAGDLLFELGVPTLRGGFDAGKELVSKWESPDNDITSVLLPKAFANDYELPPRTSSMGPPPLAHRHTAPPKVSLPNPLKVNPPEPSQSPPPPPTVELEGTPIGTVPKIRSRDISNGAYRSSRPNRCSVIYGGFEHGSPFLPIIEQVEDIPLPELNSSASSGQASPQTRSTGQSTPKSATQAQKSPLPAIGPLPLEMREPLHIWQKYMKTGVIDVEICPEALDGDGKYSWMHCWGLFNLYIFGASFMNDTVFADRVMDMLCEKIKPGHAADVDTICLVFAGRSISSRLKHLVIDRCIDAGTENFRRSFSKHLHHEFAAFALEAAMERLTDSEWRQRVDSPCRYHRHKRDEDCYLRDFASKRDKRIIENRVARKSRSNSNIRFELDTIKFKQLALDDVVELSGEVDGDQGSSKEPGVVVEGQEDYPKALKGSGLDGVASVQDADQDTSIMELDGDTCGDQASCEEPAVVIGQQDDYRPSTSTEPKGTASVQDADLGTSVTAAADIEDDGATTAKFCKIIKQMEAPLVVNIVGKSSPSSSIIEQEGTHAPTLLQEWSLASELSRSEDCSPPGAYPESNVSRTLSAPTMWLLNLLEYLIGRLLYRRRGYDADCLFNTAPFASHPKPTIPLESPDCGASGAQLRDDYSAFGAGRIPSFTWPATSSHIKEYLFLAEDPDAPLGHANVHGIYLGIPASTTSLSPEDLEVVREEDGVKVVKSGWTVGKNRRGWVYVPARPPRGHGSHRYFFMLVGLSERLDLKRLSRVPTKEEVVSEIEGKVVEWGLWKGTYESRV
ncbi:hypothetical protein SLS60_005751 [Paraconiothyrium brasiliense]|uniref:PEBP-like protein n=1 Tax=Paraconiothyrium brasiliense TaxID=300254 RepID=A0ABR3RD33_9PLEO